MGPRRGDGWLNVNIFFQKLLAGEGGGVGFANFFRTCVIFPEILKNFQAFRNFPSHHVFYYK
jgi:hypothetical protein